MKFFNALLKTSGVGNGTVGDLLDWIQRYVDILFPENGIDYWSERSLQSLARTDVIPKNIDHFAVYVRSGHCEGLIIMVGIVLKDGSTFKVSFAKTFGKEEESWMIARAISTALESIYLWEELPELVLMAEAVPRKYKWNRESSLQEPVILRSTDNSLTVLTESGLVLSQFDGGDSPYVKYEIEAKLKDWNTILKNMGVTVQVKGEQYESVTC
jgi:hypothetical protein